MYPTPPIIIINGFENDNDNTLTPGRPGRMTEYCQDHRAHEEILRTHSAAILELKENQKGMGNRISDRVKSKVFWAMVSLAALAIGGVFAKQSDTYQVVSKVNTTNQLIQKDIQMIQSQLTHMVENDDGSNRSY